MPILSEITLAAGGIGLLLGFVGYLLRRRHPRLAVFLGSLMFVALGAWMLVSTYELAMQGQAHELSRRNATFAKAGREEDYASSIWLHAILGAVVLAFGCALAIASVVKKNIRFSR